MSAIRTRTHRRGAVLTGSFSLDTSMFDIADGAEYIEMAVERMKQGLLDEFKAAHPNAKSARAVLDLRCDFCGKLHSVALKSMSENCAPPFIVQPHQFTGRHPADRKQRS